MFRRALGSLFLLCSLLLLIGSFRGPFTFIRRPTLIITPLYAPSFTVEQIAEIRRVLEREIAAEGSHVLYPKSLIENFYLERDNSVDVFDGEYRSKEEAFTLGKELNVERVAIVFITQYAAKLSATISIYDVNTELQVGSASDEELTLDSLLNWADDDNQALTILDDIGESVAGMSVGAWLYIIWLIFLLIIGFLLISGLKTPQSLVEILWSSGLLLSLFSWIYALNGDMDYVQRFVATSGVLSINDTQAERIAALVRYLLPMILLAVLWFTDQKHRMKKLSMDALDAAGPFGAMLSALIYTLALPNFLVLEGLPLLAWFALSPLYIVLRRVGFGRAIGLILLFLGLKVLLINWWQGTFSYVSLPFTVSLTLIKNLPFVLILAATFRFFPKISLWAAPFLWVAFDWIHSFGFLGYPWGLLGVSQYANPNLIQIASFGGIWIVSLLPHLSSAVFAYSAEKLLHSHVSGRRLFTRALWLPPLSMILVVFLVSIGGRINISQRDKVKEGRSVRILGVQQNTDPRKHDYHLSFEELTRLTGEALKRYGSFDLIAWPESAFVPDIRFWLDAKRSKWKRGKLVRGFLDWQSGLGLPLVSGNQDHYYESAEPENIKHIQNSSVYLPPNRRDDYDRHYYYKIRLVPFTENFPYREQFPWIAELLHNFSTTQWTPGSEYIVHEAPAFRFATPICFEDIFPNHVRRFVLEGSEVLVNISNDYWANTPLEGYQHAAHAVFRTVENRRPLIRATSSGWTISVDTEGRIDCNWPDFYTPGYVIGQFTLPEEPQMSFYTRYGDWLPLLCLLAWCILVAAGNFNEDSPDTRKPKVN